MNKIKRVCIIIGGLAGGGIERSMLTISKQLSYEGVLVDIICLKNKVEYNLEEYYNVHYLSDTSFISKNKILNFYLLRKMLLKKINLLETDGKINLYISSMYQVDRLVKSLNLANVYFYIQNLQSILYKDKSFLKKRVFKFVYKNENLLVASNGLKKDLLDNMNIKPKTIETIYNSFDFKAIREQAIEPIDFNDKFILHIGKFMPQKRHDILLKAYKKANIEQKLVLLGSGYEENSNIVKNIKKIIKDLNLEKKVKIMGFDSNPYKYMSKADLFVLSSDFEGFGNVLVEALISGTKVVSTNCKSGPSEILVENLSIFLSPVGNIELLSKNIKKALISDYKVSNTLLEKFNVEVVVKNFLNKIQDL